MIKPCGVVHCKHCNACKILLMMHIRLPSICGECTTPHLCLPSVALCGECVPSLSPFLPDQPSDPALARWPIANTGGVDCAIVLSISTVSLRRQCTLVLYLAAGVVEEWLSEAFGEGRRIDRHFELCSEVWIRFPLERASNQRSAVHFDSR